MSKWGGRPHWEYDAVFLGSDEHGEWLGCPVGTHYSRPGMELHARFASAVLVPAGGRPHLAAFNTAEAKVGVIYVDVTTQPAWDGDVLRSIDLDLDVVKRHDGTVYVDDEDEFAEHRVRFGYPPDVVAMAEESAAALLAAMREGVAPYDGTGASWLARLLRRN
jgi:hypothetical protein